MTETTEQTKPKAAKPAPDAKKEITTLKRKVTTLENKIDRLEAFLGKMAHWQGGNIPKLCAEFDIKVYNPQLKDMSRHG